MRKRHTLWLRLIALACVAFVAHIANAAELRPFVARYQVRFYGISGGILQFTLRKGSAPNEYVYESRAEPSVLGSFMISSSARESSTMLIDENGVRPLAFLSDDGKKGDEKDSNVRFDWTQNRLTGRSERVDFDQPLPEHIQDHLSIQVAVMDALLNNRDLGEFSLIDTGEIKRYRYSKEGNGTIKIKGRSMDAVIVRSERADSPGGRINRYWHSTENEFVALRAERSRDGKIDLTIDLVDFKYSE